MNKDDLHLEVMSFKLWQLMHEEQLLQHKKKLFQIRFMERNPTFFQPLWNSPKLCWRPLRVFPQFCQPPAKWKKTYFHYISVGLTLVKRSIWFLQLLSFIILIFRIYLWQPNLFKLKQTYCEFLTLLIFLVACYTFVVAIFIIHITFSSINLLLTCDIINTDTYKIMLILLY